MSPLVVEIVGSLIGSVAGTFVALWLTGALH